MDRAHRFRRLLRLLLSLGALATASVALWLVGVSAFVLPRSDPDHVVLWAWIAAALLLYAGLTFAFAVRGSRPGWLSWAVVTLSLVSLAFGGHAIDHTLRAPEAGGHFEGYLLVIGVLLAAQGLLGLATATLHAWRARSAPAA